MALHVLRLHPFHKHICIKTPLKNKYSLLFLIRSDLHQSAFLMTVCLSPAAWLHGDHVFSECEWEFDNAQDSLTHVLQWVNTGGERNDEDVEPCDQEADGPSDKPQAEKPEDCPENTRAEITTSRTFSLSHDEQRLLKK